MIIFLVDFIISAKIDFFGEGIKISRDFNFAISSLLRISRFREFSRVLPNFAN